MLIICHKLEDVIMDTEKSKVFGGLYGLCIGDALGVPVEFVPREELKAEPINDMIGYRVHNQPPGTWSDDSSLTFCLAESLCYGLNLSDMANRFVKWLDEGYWTPYGKVFDVGRTTRIALSQLKNGVDPIRAGPDDEYSNGNGSLMRILPLAYYLEEKELKQQFEITHQVSCITHGHPRSQIACGIYIQILINLLRGNDPKTAYERMKEIVLKYYSKEPYADELACFDRILNSDISKFPEDSIRSSGYVVDTLEASIWCFLNNNSYKDTVLAAVNLGGDTDTIGAVTGGLAGVFYGYEGIPQKWVSKLAMSGEIAQLGERLYEAIYNR